MTETTPERAALRADLLHDLLAAPAGRLRRVEVVPTATSTNTELVEAVRADPAAWPAPAVLVADHQVAGRGRQGRGWETPPRSSLTASVLLRPAVPPETLGWLPLLVGLAAVHALRATAGVDASAKWPNDVLVPDPEGVPLPGWGTRRKVAGILVEAVGDGGLVAGMGVNVHQSRAELPAPQATSLAVAGAATDRESLLVAFVEGLLGAVDRWADAGGDAQAAGLDEEVAAVSATLGADVRVELPDGSAIEGRALRLAADGALVVVREGDMLYQVRAGDVLHVREVSSP